VVSFCSGCSDLGPSLRVHVDSDVSPCLQDNLVALPCGPRDISVSWQDSNPELPEWKALVFDLPQSPPPPTQYVCVGVPASSLKRLGQGMTSDSGILVEFTGPALKCLVRTLRRQTCWFLHQCDLCLQELSCKSVEYSVGIATDHGLKSWVQFLAEAKDCSVFHIVQTGPGAYAASYPISTRGQAAGSEADHSSPSSAGAKNIWSCTSTPPFVFMAWCLIKHTDKFAFTLQSQHACPCRNEVLLVGFEVLTAVFMESTVF
jgi:hypothetical protein